VAQVVAHDGWRVLVWTRTTVNDRRACPDHPDGPFRFCDTCVYGGPVQFGRVIDLSRLVKWPEAYLDTLMREGHWRPLPDPVPADALLARAKPAVLRLAP
jgi:hypothetical protein